MVETIPVIILIAGLALFSFIAIPPLLHDSDTGANIIDQLFDVEAGNATDGDILIFQNGTWILTNSSQFAGNSTGGNGTTIIIQGGNFTGLVDAYFNAEEGTVDDLTGVNCVNDITYNFFDNTVIHQYARQVAEFCGSGDIDDNITWMYVVPQQYNSSDPKDFNFRLFWADDNGGGGTFVALAENDCEENVTDGSANCTSTDLELHDTGGNDGYVAMRWLGLPIPNGATITNAQIQFHVDEVSSGTVTATFRGDDSDDSADFDPPATFEISSRNETTTSVNWVIPSWPTVSAEGPDQLTPDLSSIVQEIVDRAGWSSGNDLAIMIKDWPDNSGTRHAETQNGEAGNQPELSVSFTTGSTLPVCWEFSLMNLKNSELMDGDFKAFDTVCTNRSGDDQLTITEFNVISNNHNFTSGDLVFFKIVRPDDFQSGDFEGDAFLFGSELKWKQ